MYLRLKFKKEGPIRFVGHLDLMRTIQKTFRRANIPIAYSEGFNPHQIFSFATALAVGVSSEAEYMDLRLTQEVPKEMVIAAINHAAPMGITIIDGVVVAGKEPKAMAALTAASYVISQKSPIITQVMIDAYMAQEEAIIQKTNKKGKVNDFDIRSGSYEIALVGTDLHMKLATGSSLNIKPEMVLAYILTMNDLAYERGNYHFHRTELYQGEAGKMTLLEPTVGL